MSEPMTVVVKITVTVEDPDDWTTAYGVTGRAAIRKDVKSYIGNGVQGAFSGDNGEMITDIDWS